MAAAKKIPATYEQQQEIRQQRQRRTQQQNQGGIHYAEGSGSASDTAAVKRRSESVDYSKARSSGSASIEELKKKLADAQKRGASMLASQIKKQIEAARRAGGK